MTSSATRPWLDELDEPTRAMLLGGSLTSEDVTHVTLVEGLSHNALDLAPTRSAVIAGRLVYGHSDLAGLPFALSRVTTPAFQPAPPTQAEIMATLEEVRRQLDLTADTMAMLLGAKSRRYHNWVAGDSMPLARLNVAVGAIVALVSLLSEDRTLAKCVFETEAEEAARLISTGRLASWKALVNRVRAEQAREQQAIRPVLPVPVQLPEGMTSLGFAEAVSGAAFRAGLAVLGRLAPQTRVIDEAWRVDAYAQLEAVFEARAEGDELPEEWVFLRTLTGAGLREFRSRAQAILEDPGATRTGWDEFVAREGEQAWAAYDFEPLGPVEDVTPGASEIGVPGLLDFTNLDLDLASGELRRDQ